MKALLIVDLQNDFMPKGTLPVPGGDEIVSIINALMKKFSLVVASKDMHPPRHCSFAKSHKKKKPGDVVEIEGFSQVLWPVHCLRGTKGADFAPGFDASLLTAVFEKGTDEKIDSYSAFFDNARRKATGLGDFLKSRGVTDLYLAGVATDYCVLYSALDAADLGFSVFVVIDACRGIELNQGDIEHALAAIAAAGGKIVTAEEIRYTEFG